VSCPLVPMQRPPKTQSTIATGLCPKAGAETTNTKASIAADGRSLFTKFLLFEKTLPSFGRRR
jgi:hypothetical protein